jgi:hypothetical protein
MLDSFLIVTNFYLNGLALQKSVSKFNRKFSKGFTRFCKLGSFIIATKNLVCHSNGLAYKRCE